MNKISSRKSFLKAVILAVIFVCFGAAEQLMAANKKTQTANRLEISIFSKHLQFLDYKALGEKVAAMGFAGIDLTVRKGGHVEPATVKTDLPKAVAEIEKAGSKVTMMSTTIDNVSNQLDVDVLNTASACGIKYYRPTWFKYPEDKTLPQSLNIFALQIKELSLLNKKLGIVGCYQNHAGALVGGSLWEVYKILELADKEYFGSQYDIRHAMVEGANSWVNGLELIHSQIKTIVVKDYKWGFVNGKWELINVPIGEGMVDFKKFFRMLKKYNIKVPVSMHCEYDLGGAEKGNRAISISHQVIYDAMTKDLNKLQELWNEAEKID
jgi:sugar phosphate isomerase/epimerase